MRIPRWTITACIAVFCVAFAVADAAIGNADGLAAERRVHSARQYHHSRPRKPRPHKPSAHRYSRPRLYTGSEPTISQISPSIRRARQPRFRKWWRQRKQNPSLADALQQLPTPASETVLRDAGVPIVPGVPPIVILEPRSKEDRDRDLAIRAQQQ
jgi:hypothetical protein